MAVVVIIAPRHGTCEKSRQPGDGHVGEDGRGEALVQAVARAQRVARRDAVMVGDTRGQPGEVGAHGQGVRGGRQRVGSGGAAVVRRRAPLEPCGRGVVARTHRAIQGGGRRADGIRRRGGHRGGGIRFDRADVCERANDPREAALIGGEAGTAGAAVNGRGAGQRRHGQRGAAVIAERREQRVAAGEVVRAGKAAYGIWSGRGRIARYDGITDREADARGDATTAARRIARHGALIDGRGAILQVNSPAMTTGAGVGREGALVDAGHAVVDINPATTVSIGVIA